MSSDADLSTDDLARPEGMRERVSGGAEDRRSGGSGDRLEEGTAGGDRSGAMGGQGATREDARTVEMQSVSGQGGVLDDDAGTRQEFGGQDTGTRRDTGAAVSGGTTDNGRAPGTPAGGETGDVSLVDPADGDRFRQRWNDAQARFVDDPREAVQSADALVAELMQTLASSFSEHKGRLESAWQSGEDPDTEELRQALQRYRSFFDRLLSA